MAMLFRDKSNWDGFWDGCKGVKLWLRLGLDLQGLTVPKPPVFGMAVNNIVKKILAILNIYNV